jgi:hypothetical protein
VGQARAQALQGELAVARLAAASCATARTTGPQRDMIRAFCASLRESEAATSKICLHPRLGHVGVLATGPDRTARAQRDLAQRHGDVTRDPHWVIHAHYPVR